jgi:adenylate kinase
VIVILVGLPAAGKGTQAKLLSTDKELRLEHVAVGDLLRCQEDPELKELLKTGNLLPEAKVNELVLGSLRDLNKRYLLDGYPRSISQYNFLLKNVSTKLHAIQLDLSEDHLAERIQGRYSCCKCFAVFNDADCRAQNKVCDFCLNTTFSRRPDDKEEILKKRISEYNLHSKPLIEELALSGCLSKFDASLNPIDIFKQIKVKLLELFASKSASSC